MSNPFITPENTLAEIQKHAESCGVIMSHAPAVVVKDREGPLRAERRGHYELVSDHAHQMASFLTALRQRSFVAAEVGEIRPWLKVLEFEMPAARVTVTHVVDRRAAAEGQVLPPVAALLSFVPEAEPDTWGEQDIRSIWQLVTAVNETLKNEKLDEVLRCIDRLHNARFDVVDLLRRYIQTVRDVEGTDCLGAMPRGAREKIRKIAGQ